MLPEEVVSVKDEILLITKNELYNYEIDLNKVCDFSEQSVGS